MAVFACATTCFYSAARLGKFIVPTLLSFNPLLHVKPSNISSSTDCAGLPTTAFFLLQTKSVMHSKTVSWAEQSNTSDPKSALEAHFRINSPPADRLLFAYKNSKEKSTPLTKKKFLEVLAKATRAANLELLQKHGI